VLAPFPLLLEHETASYLNRTAKTLAEKLSGLRPRSWSVQELLARLGLPRTIRKVLQKNAANVPLAEALRVMRFDFHLTPEGWHISEVNADVPGRLSTRSLDKSSRHVCVHFRNVPSLRREMKVEPHYSEGLCKWDVGGIFCSTLRIVRRQAQSS